MGCTFLTKKIIRWFNENSGKVEKDFTFRFRGKESFAYMKHFAKLIFMLLSHFSSDGAKFKLAQVFFMSVQHRKIMSCIVRIEKFDELLLQDLKETCAKLFAVSCLFTKSVLPSL